MTGQHGIGRIAVGLRRIRRARTRLHGTGLHGAGLDGAGLHGTGLHGTGLNGTGLIGSEHSVGRRRGSKLVLAASALALVGLVGAAAPAAASPSKAAPASTQAALPALHGTTSVTTAPGIVAALVGKGVLPLPVAPRTAFRLGTVGGALVATYGFPIYQGNPDLSGPSGDILHLGGIYFLGVGGKHLSIRNFDIDLAAGKVFANRVNGAEAHVAILDLDLSGLQVGSKDGATVLSGIKVNLDAQAAGALNATFTGLDLPAGLAFGTARVVLKG